MGEKKNRLFVRGECTDDTWVLCGGPDTAEAMKGLMNALEMTVECILDLPDHEDIEIKTMSMTDEEVEALPDA